MTTTASKAKPIDPDGELYQQRALGALPILVRQAWAGRTIYYSDAAYELAMENPRNMDFVLGSVGNSLRLLGQKWGEEIPPLQAIAINKVTGLPGEGFTDFAPDPTAFRKASFHVKRQVIDSLLGRVYSYPRWPEVLSHFGATLPAASDLEELLPTQVRKALGSVGESEAHRQLKMYVAANPRLVDLPPTAIARVEHCFPSSDTTDVLFTTANEWVAVEVKSKISSDYDILRGIFQCVKYQALVDAVVAVERRKVNTRTVLVLEAALPVELRSVVNTLGVAVLENVGFAPTVSNS